MGGKRLAEDKYSATGKTKLQNSSVMGDSKSRFELAEFIKKSSGAKGLSDPNHGKTKQKVLDNDEEYQQHQ